MVLESSHSDSFACSCLVFSTTFIEKAVFFPVVYSCLICHRWIDHMCMGLFLGSLFSSTDLCVYFCASTMLFWLVEFCGIIWNQGLWYFWLCYFFSRLFCLFRVICVSIQILNYLFQVCEKCYWYFDRDCIDSVDCFG